MRRLIATAVASSKIAVIFFPFAQTQERGSLRREGPAPRKNHVLGISQSTLVPCVPRSAGGIGRPSQHAPGALPHSTAPALPATTLSFATSPFETPPSHLCCWLIA